MTGTASTESEEFHQIYKLDVVEVPPNRPASRKDRPDRIYKTEQGKFKALIREVAVLHQKGQPVLIGTASIEKNEVLSDLLTKSGIPHQTLNAKNNEREANIVAKAGTKGAVTLATNIAGRGTDIVLGDGIKELDGLFVLGSERHESRRIDNQLRGRSGRQGDPGVTQFFVSTEDDLMRIFGGERISGLMNRLGVDDSTPIENRIISKSLEAAQKKVEGYNFDTRKQVVQYDDVMNRHRKAIYAMRREILLQPDISKRVKSYIKQEIKDISESPDLLTDNYESLVRGVFPIEPKFLDELFDSSMADFEKNLTKIVDREYKEKEKKFTPEIMRKVEREVYLQILDDLWMQHLENMDHLREGIHWMSVGQRDPLVEYRRQGQALFDAFQLTLRNNIVKGIFSAQPVNDSNILNEPFESNLTRAARQSVDNASRIIEADEFEETDFKTKQTSQNTKKNTKSNIKKQRKAERQRRAKGKKRR
jgi:preprotein translocase subunit SecA